MGGGWGGDKAVVYLFRRGVGVWGVGGVVTRRWYICSDEGWVGGWVRRSQSGSISVQTRSGGVGGWGGHKAVVYRFRRGVGGWVDKEVSRLAVVYRFRRGGMGRVIRN